MSIKLRDEDYIALALWATPAQISKEFGDIAHSERQIYRIFKRLGINSTREARGKLRKKCELELGKMKHFNDIVKVEREKAFKNIWARIEEIQKIYEGGVFR